MGAVCSAAEVLIADEFDMPGLPAEAAQHIFMDIEGAPKFVPHFLKVEIVRGKPSTVGACWLETRVWNGTEVVIRKSITKMSKDPFFTVCATMTNDSKARWNAPKVDQTLTFILEPKNGSKGCVTKWTIAAVPIGVYSNFSPSCFTPLLSRA